MGLDGVELIMDIETTFDIRISDEEAVKIRTVGDLHACVLQRIEQREFEKCASAVLFYRLRRHVVQRGWGSRALFRPEVSLNTLITKDQRREEAELIGKALALKTPVLVLPQRLQRLANVVYTILLPGTFFIVLAAVLFFHVSSWWWLALAAGIGLALLVHQLLEPWRTDFEEDTVRSFIGKIVAMNMKQLRVLYQFNHQEIIQVINFMVQEKTGAKLSAIVPEADLVYDLKID